MYWQSDPSLVFPTNINENINTPFLYDNIRVAAQGIVSEKKNSHTISFKFLRRNNLLSTSK